METFKKILQSNWTAFLLGLLIIFLVFIVSPRGTINNIITGFGTVLWVAYWVFRAKLK